MIHNRATVSLRKLHTPAAILLVFGVTILLFAFSVWLRQPWFGVPTAQDGLEAWTSHSAVIFTDDWYRHGGWSNHFAMYQQPASVELTEIERDRYTSYPPTAFIPIYMLSLLRASPPTLGTVMTVNLTCHLIVSLLTAMIVFLFACQQGIGVWTSAAFSLVPVPIILLTRGPLYLFQQLYWTDHAVIPLALALVLLELIRDGTPIHRRRRILWAASCAVMFVGTATDWYFLIVVLVVYIKRLLAGEFGLRPAQIIRASVPFALPVILSLCLFITYLMAEGRLSVLIDKAIYRTGLIPPVSPRIGTLSGRFWPHSVPTNLGRFSPQILWGCLGLTVVGVVAITFRYLRRLPSPPALKASVRLAATLTIPCFVHAYLLSQHTAEHEFAVLKFLIMMAIVPLAIVPIVTIKLLSSDAVMAQNNGDAKPSPSQCDRRMAFTAVACLMISIAWTLWAHRDYEYLFPERNSEIMDVGQFIANHTDHKDVVFSASLEIPKAPMTALAWSHKRVYRVDSLADIAARIEQIADDCDVVLFTWPFDPPLNGGLDLLAEASQETAQQGMFSLRRISKNAFLKAWPQWRQSSLASLKATAASTTNAFDLHDLAVAVRGLDPVLHAQLLTRIERLNSPSRQDWQLCPQAELLDIRHTRRGPQNWRVDLLLRVNQKFHDDLSIYLHGYVPEDQRDKLPPKRQQVGYVAWTFSPVPATTLWPERGELVISHDIIAKDLSYHFFMGFWSNERGESFGRQIDLRTPGTANAKGELPHSR